MLARSMDGAREERRESGVCADASYGAGGGGACDVC
jgi:hypothetical protein